MFLKKFWLAFLFVSGTVLIKSAEELMNFSRGEENLLELQIKAIADSGAKVIVAGAKFGDMALHYLHKYGMMSIRLNSKFDLRRLSKTVINSATLLTLRYLTLFSISTCRLAQPFYPGLLHRQPKSSVTPILSQLKNSAIHQLFHSNWKVKNQGKSRNDFWIFEHIFFFKDFHSHYKRSHW